MGGVDSELENGDGGVCWRGVHVCACSWCVWRWVVGWAWLGGWFEAAGRLKPWHTYPRTARITQHGTICGTDREDLVQAMPRHWASVCLSPKACSWGWD